MARSSRVLFSSYDSKMPSDVDIRGLFCGKSFLQWLSTFCEKRFIPKQISFRRIIHFHISRTARSVVECRVGGTGAESGTIHRVVLPVCTGDFGKPTRHPPRKRGYRPMRRYRQWPTPNPILETKKASLRFWREAFAHQDIPVMG